ncbi:glycerophosphoryl diester phosphodiesterase membrane domain-containing protein [Streptomyces sp. NPDC058052]|uniref:glycerophosphoryl diester phosphodiesterase membrane domain-containing protein n=1 Tax=Streptomyces sp. NPDC058052 TaxID=3346316 RepID=UPI0036F10D2E
MNDTPGRNTPGSAPSDGQDGPAIPGQSSPTEPNDSAPQWSKDQPPAGRWSPPAPGRNRPPAPGRAWATPPPQRGWGGHGPAVPKPGVIPLRPLAVGEILEASVSTLRRYWRTVLAVTIPVAVVTQVALMFVQRYLSAKAPALHADATPAEQLEAISAYLRASVSELGPTMLVSVAASVFTSALLTVVVSRAVLGRPVTLSEAWREASPRLPQLLVLSLALPLGAGLLAFVAMLPGLLLGGAGGATLAFLGGTAAFLAVIWLLIRFSLASPALMLERQGVVAALKRSAKLVTGSWWRVFGITVLAQLLITVFTMVLTIPFTAIAFAVDGGAPASGLTLTWTYLIVMAVGGIVSSALTYPVAAGVTVFLYVDQRIRRESLDVELTKAAETPAESPSRH